MKLLSILMGVVTAIVVFAISASETQAARNCGYGWAVPGTYRITGDFRGTTESGTAKLTNDCRVILQIPGVFSGGSVRRSAVACCSASRLKARPAYSRRAGATPMASCRGRAATSVQVLRA
jgi:hypothetical protein